MIDLGLDRARAVVIGAGFIPHRAGFGRGSALQLAAAGAEVACVDMDEARANEIVGEIQKAGGRAFPVIGDVRSEAEAKRIVDEAVTGLGGIDVLVDVVGESIFDRSDRQTEEDWDYQMLKNLKQFFFVVKGAAPHFIEQGTGGSICQITSVDGLVSSRYHVAYGAAKAGVISLVKTYSDELGKYGVRVNCVAPGNVGGGVWDEPDIPFGEEHIANSLAPPRPMDIANGVLFLSSALAKRVTGQTLVVDGGATTRSPWASFITEDSLRGLNAAGAG